MIELRDSTAEDYTLATESATCRAPGGDKYLTVKPTIAHPLGHLSLGAAVTSRKWSQWSPVQKNRASLVDSIVVGAGLGDFAQRNPSGMLESPEV